MARSSTLLAFVRPSEHRRAWLSQEAETAACELHFTETLQSAVLGLAARRPAAVIVDVEWPECEALCDAVRSRRREVDIAVFGVADRLKNETFASALRRGVDDLVAFHTDGALGARVVSLPADPFLPPPLQGDALVAMRDRAQAARIGRTLTNAGYEVEFAADAGGVGNLAILKRVRLVVTDARPPEVRARLAQARSAGSRAIWVVLASGAELATLEQVAQGLEGVAALSASDPAENILFVSNDVAAAHRREFRVEPRLLHGTLVAFRSAGDKADDFGYTYNVSSAGIYVRTLAPPLEPVVWIELCPPGSSRRVRLEGRVAWTRAFGRFGTATAPPGFGVHITGGLAGDQEAWSRGCALLAQHRGEGLALESPDSLGPRQLGSAPALDSPAAKAAPPEPSSRNLQGPAASAPKAAVAPELPVARPAPAVPEEEIEEVPLELVKVTTPPPPRSERAVRASESPRSRSSVKPKALSSKPSRRPPAPTPPKPRTPWILWILVAGVASAVAWVGLRSFLASSGREPLASPSAAAEPSMVDQPTRAALGSSAPEPRPTQPALSAEVSPSASAEPPSPDSPTVVGSVLPAASGSESLTEDPPDDPAKLLATEGYLRVASSLDTLVFVHAMKSGKTNTWLRVPCGWRWIRLGRTGGYWQSEGASRYVTCRGVTRMTIEPSR